MKRLLASFLACSALAWPAPSPASPEHAYGFGSRAIALGGALAADQGSAASLFYNPALLALAPHSQLLLGYRTLGSDLTTSGEPAEVPDFGSFDGALLGRGELFGIPVGFGLGLALTNGHLSRVRSVPEDEPHWPLRETLPELVDLKAALGFRPLGWLSLGVGAGFLATTQGGFDVAGSATLSDGQGSEYDSQLRHSVDAELLSVRYLLLGAELALPRLGQELDWRLGISFRDEAKLEQALRGTLHGTVDAGPLQIPVSYSFESHGLVAFQPRQLVLGVAAQRGPTQVGLDVAWEQWSRYPSPFARSASHIEAELPPGFTLELPPDMELPAAESAGFHDRVTFRLGVERWLTLSAASALALRAGYAYLPTPAPLGSRKGQLIDASEHVLSLGAGLKLERLARYLPRTLELDAHALWSHLPSLSLDRDGDELTAQGNAYSFGATLTASFGR